MLVNVINELCNNYPLTRDHFHHLTVGQKNKLNRAALYDSLHRIANQNPNQDGVALFAYDMTNYSYRNGDSWTAWVEDTHRMKSFPEYVLKQVISNTLGNTFVQQSPEFNIIPGNGEGNGHTRRADLYLATQQARLIVEVKANDASFNEAASASTEFALIDRQFYPHNKPIFLMLTFRHNNPIKPSTLLSHMGLKNLPERTHLRTIMGNAFIDRTFFDGNGDFLGDFFMRELQNAIYENIRDLFEYLNSIRDNGQYP